MAAHRPAPPWARLLGLGIALAWFVALPALVKPRWAAFVDALGGLPGVVVWGSTLVHVAMLLVGNAGFALLYYARFPAIERFKVSPKPWPWLQGPKARAEIFALVRQGVGLTLLNNLLATLVAVGNVGVMRQRGLTVAGARWPSTFTLVWQTLAFILVEDTCFYACHRALHAYPAVYKRVHKLHHRWTHSLSAAAESTHWAEFLLGNALPVVAGPLLVGDVHAYTLLQWVAFRVWETMDGHSGYDLPWQPFRLIPLAGSAGDHDAHHSKNTGNFESFLHLWDPLLGTAIAPAVAEDEDPTAPPPEPAAAAHRGRAHRGKGKAA